MLLLWVFNKQFETCHCRKEFAYSSTDKMVYIRKFSTTGSKMTLVNTLQGHDAEVTCVRWNTVLDKWITGSEDGTIRIWVLHHITTLFNQVFNENPGY